MRTSISECSLAPRLSALLLAPVVDRAVGDVAQRDVDEEHEEGQRDACGHALLEEDRDEDREQRRCDAGTLGGAFPGRRTVHPLLAPALRVGANLGLRLRPALGRSRRVAAAVMRRALDDPGGVPAVLALAFGLSHQDDCERSSASSMVRRLRSGISAGKLASAAAGARPTSSAPAMRARSPMRATISGSDAAR